jgi:hypothetical protein
MKRIIIDAAGYDFPEGFNQGLINEFNLVWEYMNTPKRHVIVYENNNRRLVVVTNLRLYKTFLGYDQITFEGEETQPSEELNKFLTEKVEPQVFGYR